MLDDWLGRFLTEPKQTDSVLPLDPPLTRDAILHSIARHPLLLRNPWARLAYIQREDMILLFAGGHRFEVDTSLFEAVLWLCDHQEYNMSTMSPWLQNHRFVMLLTELINLGVVLIDDEQ